MTKIKREINVSDYLKINHSNSILVDTRENDAYRFGTIEGAVNIPFDKISELYNLPKNKVIYLFCQTGETTENLTDLLADAGYEVYNITGGYREYLKIKFYNAG
ncbi:MAG: rhodanese-like domain-containing protein [Candidatus Gastranaerophilales bacterium]|nr:rhodanese-like domain-containing protein [Candidatus Gastranaerophilales bacterium]